MSFTETFVGNSLLSKTRASSFKEPSRSIYSGTWRSKSLKVTSKNKADIQHISDTNQASPPPEIPSSGGSDLFRVRSFRTHAKGFENRGDSFRRRRQTTSSTGSGRASRVASTSSEVSNFSESSDISIWTTVSEDCVLVPSYYRVVFIGASGVGKTSLIKQCKTSDFVVTESLYDDDYEEANDEENTVCVVLDGEESIVELFDSSSILECEMSQVDAYVVVFSLTSVTSFKVATSVVQQLRVERSCDRSIIMVGTKSDLARQRKIQGEDGGVARMNQCDMNDLVTRIIENSKIINHCCDVRRVATDFTCKCIETSTAINHNVDSLVVGILTQIRLKAQHGVSKTSEKTDETVGPVSSRRSRALTILTRLFKHSKTCHNSCENLLQ